MLTFDEAFAAVPENVRPAIVLGNGFSQAWSAGIFNYASLFQVADFENREDQIREIFERLNTWDFEAVMRTLQAAQLVAEVHALDPALIETIQRDQEILKQALLSAVSNNVSPRRIPS